MAGKECKFAIWQGYFKFTFKRTPSIKREMRLQRVRCFEHANQIKT